MDAVIDSPVSNRAKLWQEARKNTVKNKDGQTVLTKDSPYRDEEGWELSVKEKKSK